MSKIRVLPDNLANKIAAGEIVERPASAVKELLENSIDAHARSIRIEIEAGGKKRILVRDDGEGMSQDDAILAFEHHSTSKLMSVEDLGAIATLGFRGEALPSIASISRLGLRTRQADNPDAVSGTEIEIQGGIIRSVKPVPWDRGTEVAVRDLFFNVPARRKFLRSHETELGHITRLVTHYALAHPEVRFVLESAGKNLINAAPVSDLRDRIYQIFGEGFLDNLVEIEGASGGVRVYGFSSRPHEQRTNAYSQFYYVNRRMVRDRVLTSALRQAYRNCMPASAYPVVLLFVELPFDQVDVNAHPAKIEIRFRQQNVVFELVRDSIDRALVRSRSIPSYEHRTHALPQNSLSPPVPSKLGHGSVPVPESDPYSLVSPASASDAFQKAFHYPFREVPAPFSQTDINHSQLKLRADMLLDAPSDHTSPFHPGGVRILGQLQESYIIGCDQYGLLIIDQHVAHERILYEKIARSMQNNSMEIQGLLVPVTLELPPHQIALLEQVMPELNRNGFQVERFGGNSVCIRSVPAIAGDADCRRLFPEILEGLESDERTSDVERIRDRIAIGTACRSAVKVHMPLTVEKMQWLLDELSRTRIPTNCPHGRPIILRFSLYEIERNFGRA